MAMKVRDIETSNAIIRIVNEVDWNTDEFLGKNMEVLTEVKKNKGFLELVNVTE